MKRDINFIRHEGTKLKERERRDKSFSREHRYEKACEKNGIPVERRGLNIEDIGIISSILKRLKDQPSEHPKGGSR